MGKFAKFLRAYLLVAGSVFTFLAVLWIALLTYRQAFPAAYGLPNGYSMGAAPFSFGDKAALYGPDGREIARGKLEIDLVGNFVAVAELDERNRELRCFAVDTASGEILRPRDSENMFAMRRRLGAKGGSYWPANGISLRDSGMLPGWAKAASK